MLGALRGVARTPVALVFIFLLAASFAVWGLSDVFVGRASGALASAGDRHIYQNDLERRIGYYLENERARGTYTDIRSAAKDGTIQQIFNSMSQNLSLLENAHAAGLTASRRGIARRIAASGGFGDPVTGKFDRQSYRRFLQSSGDSQKGFEAALRDDMTMEYLRDVSAMAVSPPENLIRQWLLPYLENRSFAYVVVPEAGDVPTPDQSQIQDWYEDNSDRYTTPETRELAVFSLSADDYLHTVEVSDDDIAAAYDRNGENYAGPKKRELIEAITPIRKPLELLADRLNTGASIDDAFTDLDRIIQLPRTVREDEIGDDKMLEAAFQLPEGTALIPFRDEKSGLWKTLIVKRIVPRDIPQLDDIRAQLIGDIERRHAREAFVDDRNETLVDLIGGGFPVDEIAAELGGVVTSYPPVSSDGHTADDTLIDALGTELLQAAFALNEGETSTEIETSDGVHIVQVLKITPRAPVPIDQVRDDIRNTIMTRERRDQARSIARTIADRASDPDTLQTAASALGLRVHTYEEQISRSESNGELDPAIVEAVFRLAPGRTDVLARPGGAALVLLLTEVALDNDMIDQYLRIGKSSLSRSLGSQIADAAGGVAHNRIPIRINARAFEEYTRFLLGESEPG